MPRDTSQILVSEITAMRDQIKEHLGDLNKLENLVLTLTGAIFTLYATGKSNDHFSPFIIAITPQFIIFVGFFRFLALTANIYAIDHYTRGIEKRAFGPAGGWATAYRSRQFHRDVYQNIDHSTQKYNIPLCIVKNTNVGQSRLFFWISLESLSVLFMIYVLLKGSS